METSVGPLVFFSKCSPTGLMSMEEVPIDPEVVVVIEWLDWFIHEQSAARMCR